MKKMNRTNLSTYTFISYHKTTLRLKAMRLGVNRLMRHLLTINN